MATISCKLMVIKGTAIVQAMAVIPTVIRTAPDDRRVGTNEVSGGVAGRPLTDNGTQSAAEATGPADQGVPGPTGLVSQQYESPVVTYPLQPADPPRIGPFWPDSRLVATASGVAYLAHCDDGTDPVMVIMLSQGATDDPAARDRLAGQVDHMDIDTVVASHGLGRDHTSAAPEDDWSGSSDPAAAPPSSAPPAATSPWVALAFDQTGRAVDEARRVLSEVDLSRLPQQGQPSGPDYRLHWTDRFTPGLSRVWPLPWPGRRERGGWLTILASWLLMLLLAAIAVLIAILIFSRAPQTSPPPPIPTQQTTSTQTMTEPPPPDTASPSPSSASGSPSEATPSPSSASASPSSASPSASSGSASPSPSPSASQSNGSGSPTPSASASPSGSGTETASAPMGSPTPPSRL